MFSFVYWLIVYLAGILIMLGLAAKPELPALFRVICFVGALWFVWCGFYDLMDRRK